VNFRLAAAAALCVAVPSCSLADSGKTPFQRVVILKVDGLNAELLYENMRQINEATGKPVLPWFAHIFGQNGTTFENFYTRGISLSAPSWSMLDTGQHAIIRGNVEWDRYTEHVYDYLNFFPFYLGYARNRQIDMQGVEVLDRAGIPLIIDRFQWDQVYQSFQLYQRGARWRTLQDVLKQRFSSRVLIPSLESAGAPSLDEMLGQQTEKELVAGLQDPDVLYLDYYTGDLDHEGHATNQPAALLSVLKRLDALTGRIWTAIQKSSLAQQTLFVVVSDHGMNNVPDIHSEGFNLPDFFSSAAGGGHHVLLNRHELQDYKMVGLNPLVHRAYARSTDTFYLPGQVDEYPTAWLDLDGNERASVSLRNNDLNKIHILLLQLAKRDLQPNVRAAAAAYLSEVLDKHREGWSEKITRLEQELNALQSETEDQKQALESTPKKFTHDDYRMGRDKAVRRHVNELAHWEQERDEYTAYIAHLRALMKFKPDAARRFSARVQELVPPRSLGDANTLYDLQNYVVGPEPAGMVLDTSGNLDEQRSFRTVNYFPLLAAQRVRNNPQAALSSKPIDFTALRLPDAQAGHETYWLYCDDDHQLLIRTDESGNIQLQPVSHLVQDADGKVDFTAISWKDGLPLHLFEDAELQIPSGTDRATWLSGWHREREWLEAINLCKYSNGVIGITEELSPVAANVPGTPGMDPVLVSYEQRRRELVQPDIEVFASDHWNFNARNFNPGGNHGAFFRISTHSVWLLAGAGVPAQDVTEPYDSLNFASTVLNLLGKTPPMPDRVVNLAASTQASAR
jgi:hypothetical protein